MKPHCLVFDVETIGDRRLLDDPDFCEAFRERVRPPSNYVKDEAKAKYRDSELDKWRNGGAAVKPWSAQIVAIGWADLDQGKVKSAVSYTMEASILRKFALALKAYSPAGCALAGHNIRKFDVPLVTMRCAIHRVELPRWWPYVGDYGYTQADTFDLFPHKLAEIAAAHALPEKLSSGDKVAEMTADECRKYVKQDVRIERELVRIYRDRFKALRERKTA